MNADEDGISEEVLTAACEVLSFDSWWQLPEGTTSDTPNEGSSGATPSSVAGGADCCRGGAFALVKRCMREYDWDYEFASRVSKGYRQFLELKVNTCDFEDRILFPPICIERMWRQHILDVRNYRNDSLWLCGNVVLHDSDRWSEDDELRAKHVEITKIAGMARFSNQLDPDVWIYEEENEEESQNEDEENTTATASHVTKAGAHRSIPEASPVVATAAGETDDSNDGNDTDPGATAPAGTPLFGRPVSGSTNLVEDGGAGGACFPLFGRPPSSGLLGESHGEPRELRDDSRDDSRETAPQRKQHPPPCNNRDDVLPVDVVDVEEDGRRHKLKKHRVVLSEAVDAFTIFVRPPSGKTYSFVVDRHTPVSAVKAKVGIREGLALGRLIFCKTQNRPVVGGWTVADCYISPGDTIYLRLVPRTIQIRVKTLSGRNVTLNASPTDTVETIKRRCCQAGACPSSHGGFVLLFGTKRLEMESWTLSDYNISDRSRLDLTLPFKATIDNTDAEQAHQIG